MKLHRRDFIKSAGVAAGALLFTHCANTRFLLNGQKKANSMILTFKPYLLQLKHAFNLAQSSRTTTPIMLVKIDFNGFTGYGEASMPPYLGESHETVAKFLAKTDLSQFPDPFRLDDILDYIDGIEENNRAAKASIDMALHDLIGKITNQPLYNIWGINPQNTPLTSFTIGMDTPEIVQQKTLEAAPFKILKVKLGRNNDKELIETIRAVTDKPIVVDVNQGWTDKKLALDMIHWLNEKNVLFVEQPMPKEMIDEMAWLTQNSPLPTFADEAFQRKSDIVKFKGVYSGINIKLMKSTGLREAHQMIIIARALGMKVMIGCMTETSCAVSAAAQLSAWADFADLDGNLLITNDIYDGVKVIDGKITLNNLPGIGVKALQPDFFD